MILRFDASSAKKRDASSAGRFQCCNLVSVLLLALRSLSTVLVHYNLSLLALSLAPVVGLPPLVDVI